MSNEMIGSVSSRHRRSPSFRATVGMSVVLTTQTMLALDTSVVNVALPDIQVGLGFSTSSLSWVINAYTLAFGGILLIGGRLGDMFGRRRVFAIGVAMFAIASLFGGLAQSAVWLDTARAVQGVGAALAAPSILALITANAPDDAARHRGLAMFAAFSMGGNAAGLVLGGVLTGALSWRWTLFINIPIAVAVLTFLWRFVNETERHRGRFDFVGGIAAAASAVSFVYAVVTAPDEGWGSPVVMGFFALSAILLAVLIVAERRVAAPLLWLGLLAHRTRLAGLTVSMLAMAGQIGMFYFIVQYLQRTLHMDPLLAGVAFIPETASIFAISRLGPRLVHRIGARAVLIAALSGLIVSYAWFACLHDSGSYWTTVFPPLVLNGLAAGITFMPATALALTDVDPLRAGSASALVQTAQQLGGSVGLAVLVTVYAGFADPQAFTVGLAQTFISATSFGVIALASVLMFVRRPQPAGPGRK